jgi:hypothetical protein
VQSKAPKLTRMAKTEEKSETSRREFSDGFNWVFQVRTALFANAIISGTDLEVLMNSWRPSSPR